MRVDPAPIEGFVQLLDTLQANKQRHERYEVFHASAALHAQMNVHTNPFLGHVLTQPLVAWAGDQILGMVLLHTNSRLSSPHEDTVFFSHLEAQDLPTAQALLERAIEWSSKRDKKILAGPMAQSPWISLGRTLPLSIGERADPVGKTLLKLGFQMVWNEPIFETPTFRANEPPNISGITLRPLQVDRPLMDWLAQHLTSPEPGFTENLDTAHVSWLFRRHAKHLDPRFLWEAVKGTDRVGLMLGLADSLSLQGPWRPPFWSPNRLLPPIQPQIRVDDVLLWMGWVREDHRRQSLGRALYHQLLFAAKSAGARRVIGPRSGGDQAWIAQKLQESWGSEPVLGSYFFQKPLLGPDLPPHPEEPPPFFEMGVS